MIFPLFSFYYQDDKKVGFFKVFKFYLAKYWAMPKTFPKLRLQCNITTRKGIAFAIKWARKGLRGRTPSSYYTGSADAKKRPNPYRTPPYYNF